MLHSFGSAPYSVLRPGHWPLASPVRLSTSSSDIYLDRLTRLTETLHGLTRSAHFDRPGSGHFNARAAH